MNLPSPSYRARIAGFPEINSIEELSYLLRLPITTILGYANRSYFTGYARFNIPKKPSGSREICAPVRPLKYIQAWILRNILDKLIVHRAATGFEKHKNIKTNAIKHIDQSYLINVDIKDFFPSITFNKVRSIFKTVGYNDEVAHTLACLTTFEGRLPQGSPSSPKLANLICHRMDARIQGFCRTKNMTYTRYADDITISTSNRKNIKKTLRFLNSVIQDENFELRNEKTNVFGRGDAKIVTGLVISKKEVRIGRKKYRELRSMILYAETHNDLVKKSYIDGYLNFLLHIDKKTHTMLLNYKSKLQNKML